MLKVILFIYLILPIGLLAQSQQTASPITGLGEIRFDRPLKESLKYLERTQVFDTTCEAITGKKKVYENEVYNPCLLSYIIKPHIDGANWQNGYAFFSPSGELADIFIFGADSVLRIAFEVKYGEPERVITSTKYWEIGDIWAYIDKRSGNIRISNKKRLSSFDQCKKATVKRLEQKCKSKVSSPIDLNKL